MTKFRLAIFLLLACGGCADDWLLYPSTYPMDAHGAERRMVDYKGRQIEVFIAQSPGVAAHGKPEAYSLEFCGNSMRAEFLAVRAAKRWGARPVEVWSMNYPGFGKSDGPASLRLIPESALATYDALTRVSAGKPVFVDGYSLGSTSALYVAAHRRAAGMILQSPPPLQREIMQGFGWWNLWVIAGITALEIPRELNSLTTAPQVKC
jgi:pimeloyl-ACP methyl ester carboxylesterase